MKKVYVKPEVKIIDLRKDFSLFSGCNTYNSDADSCYS